MTINKLKIRPIGKIYKSEQNGLVYDPNGIAPCVCAGCHSGVEPRIVIYNNEDE